MMFVYVHVDAVDSGVPVWHKQYFTCVGCRRPIHLMCSFMKAPRLTTVVQQTGYCFFCIQEQSRSILIDLTQT